MKSFFRQVFLFSAFLLILGSAFAEKPFTGDERPPRSIKIGAEKVFTLLPGQAGQALVVVAKDACNVTRYAAEELCTYLKKILGVDIPIVAEPIPGRHSFFIGISTYSKQAGIKDEDLCRDAYIIKTLDGDIYVLGRDEAGIDERQNQARGGIWAQLHERGSLFGVYEFLERFAGVRFYFPGEIGTFIPQKAITVPQVDIYDRPDFEARNVSIYSGQWEDEKKIKPYPYDSSVSPEKNHYYATLRLQSKYVPNCHGMALLGHVHRFGKSHPEYFALRSDGRRYCDLSMQHTGQPCLSSNLTEEIYQDAVALLTGQEAASRNIVTPWGVVWDPTGHMPPKGKAAGVFGMMPQDGFTSCRCPECSKHFSKGLQETSDFVWGKVAELAKRLKKDGIPGCVSMMSYYPYHLVPNVELPDTLLVMVATKGPWGQTDAGILKKENERIRAWVKKTGQKTWLWNYAGKFGKLNMPGIPSPTPRAIGKYYAGLRNEIFGAFMESETDKLIYHYLSYYIFSKVCWDNSADIDAILKEHCQLMFGEAAPLMENIFDRMEELWLHGIGGRTVETALGPMGAPPSENELWSKVYSSAENSRMLALFNQAEKLAASNPEALKRVKYMRQEFLNPILAASAQYWKSNDAISSFCVGMKTNSDGVKTTLLHLQPMEAPATTLKTTVTVRDDGKNLTFTFDCEEPSFDKTIAVVREQKDIEIWQDNSVEIFLNPSCDRKSYYQFMINSKGSMTDQSAVSFGGSSSCDLKWNSGARTTVLPSPGGWRAELTVPKENLGQFSEKGFVANFARSRVVEGMKTELYTWSPFLKKGFHELENFGTITFSDPSSNSLVQDGTFEVTPKGHNVFGKWISDYKTIPETKITLDESSFVFGSASIRLQSFAEEMKNLFGITQALPMLKADTKYELSYYVRCENVVPASGNGGAVVNIWDDKNCWFPVNPITGTTPWIRQSFEFTTGPKTNDEKNKSYVKLYLLLSSGTVWFDGVALSEVK